MLTRARDRQGTRLEGFDGLRAIAAFGVIAVHAAAIGWFPRGAVENFASQGQAGVEVFFVISGFLMARPFIGPLLDERAFPSQRKYWRSRFLRLFPAYWATLIVVTAVFHQTHIHSARDWLAQLTLTQVYFPSQVARGLGIAWSLSVEIAFYATLPLFFLFVARLARRTGALRALVAATGAMFAFGVLFQIAAEIWGDWRWINWLPYQFPLFATGIALAIVPAVRTRGGSWGRAFESAGRHAALCWAGAFGALVLAAWWFGDSVLFRLQHILGSQVLYSIFGVLMVLPIALPGARPTLVHRFANYRALAYVGIVSYGVYLWHEPLMLVVHDDWFGWKLFQGNATVLLVVVTPLAIAVASISWFVLEKPLLSYKDRRLLTRPSSNP